MTNDDVLSVISKVAAAESTLLNSTFIAPIVGNDTVAAKVLGIAYTFSIKVPKDPGWYQLKPKNSRTAKVVGPADAMETERYLKWLPSVRIVLMSKIKGVYHGVPIKSNSIGLQWSTVVPVMLVDDFANDFDKVVCRFDGLNLWYESVDPSNDPSKGDYLRKMFEKVTRPDKLKYSGLTFEEKAAYSMRLSIDKKFLEELKVNSIKGDVEYAGGVYHGSVEKREHYEVTYSVDGSRYTSIIAKDPARTVISAGICLSGGDRVFDLKSLITVMREGQHAGRIVRGHDHGYRDNNNDDEW